MPPRNQGVVFVLSLFICLVLGIVTADILAFIGLGHVANLNRVIHLEDLLILAIVLSLVAAVVCYVFASRRVFHHTMLLSAAIVTISIALDVAGLLRTIILQQQVNPVSLLGASVTVYISTVLVFAVWYWILDNHGQEKNAGSGVVAPVLVFPQNAAKYPGYESWAPAFIDYLFLSFHTSTTVGPTETLVLSRTGKIVMMCQVAISLIILIALAARAIGLLR